MSSSKIRHENGWLGVGRYFVLTSLLCTVIAVALWVAGLSEPLWATFVISFSIGYSINALHEILIPRLMDHLPLWSIYITATVLGMLFGLITSAWLITGDPWLFLSSNSALAIGSAMGFIGMGIFVSMSRLAEARVGLARAEAQVEAQQRQMLATQLQALQAQIEPHFLFNSLSNVSGMIRTNPDGAEQMLEHLTRLLRGSLKRTREDRIRLGDEVDILRSYLEIQSIRMGDRLSFDIDVSDEAARVELAPLLLQPLVENAVMHGIDPSEVGGRVEIRATMDADGSLGIEVRDNGVGIQDNAPASGSGVGLANIRDRLRSLYGADARLVLASNDGQGTIARLTIPTPQPASS